MSTRAQKIRLGVFMILALLLFLGAVGTLAGIKLFNPRDRYYVRFKESVSGLEMGSPVKMKGVRVGQVDKIRVSADVESVEVTLALDPYTPITVHTQAVMTAIGITGLQFVELTGGTARSKRIPPNTDKSLITPGSSTLQTLTGKAESIAIKMEAVLNNLLKFTDEGYRTRVRALLEDTDKLAITAEGVLTENRPRIKKVFANLDRTTRVLDKSAYALSKLVKENSGNVQQALVAASSAAKALDRSLQNLRPQKTLNAINSAAGSFRRRVDDPNLKRTMASMAAASARLSTTTAELNKILRHWDRQVGNMMSNLNRASRYLKDFSRAIKDRPSLLLRGETVKEKRIP